MGWSSEKRKVRGLRLDGADAWVPLTQGFWAVVDAEDAELVGQWNWHVIKARCGLVYAQRTEWVGTNKRRTVTLHRFLLGPGSEHIDHEDDDGLNCRRRNLRPATASQNLFNARKSPGPSGVRGVRAARCGRWAAVIEVAGKVHRLGKFDSIDEAAAVYAQAAVKHFGEFARVA